ncbi:hypothetical protein B0H21DRAFT_733212 [Amylocystis lapponica]|nr:hypothetical protein B0H21DRAFT_733212 [Amylocystis lapponica]
MSNPPEQTNRDAQPETPAEELWYLKPVSFKPDPESPPKNFKIITQNLNGPCSFIAICNILILRGRIAIMPPERTAVSYDFLSQLIGEYLLATCPDVDISAALSIMPVTRKGMDLNPLFTGIKSFRPAGAGGELKLFEQAGIELMHGWLVDPDSPEHRVLSQTEDYDTTVNLLVEADHLTRGRLVTSDEYAGPSSAAGPSSPTRQSHAVPADLPRPLRARLHARPGALAALFRNSHLAVLYKSLAEDGALYTLVTDQVFLHEPSVVWERLEDVDGGSSTLSTRTSCVRAPQSALAALEQQVGQEFARRLQAEEDEHAQQMLAQRERERAPRPPQRAPSAANGVDPAHKKKKDCIIM